MKPLIRLSFLILLICGMPPQLSAIGPDHASRSQQEPEKDGADDANTLELTSMIAGFASVGAAVATIILALACFGGCALAVLLVPAILFTAAGITAVITGIMALRKRRELGLPKKRRWRSIVGLIAGAASTIYGVIALISLTRR